MGRSTNRIDKSTSIECGGSTTTCLFKKYGGREVQCDLVEAPPLKQRRRLVNVVAGIQQPPAPTAVAAPTPTVAAPPTTTVPASTVPAIQSPTTGQHDFSFAQHAANLIYQDLYPVTLFRSTFRRRLGTYHVRSSDSLPYIHLPTTVPPPTSIDLQSSTTEFSVAVSPTNHVEAPDDITTSDDEWDPYSE
jgi:hypothetical protein